MLEELKVKHSDVKNIQEAEEELGLCDEMDKLPYMIGEVFLCMSVGDTLVSNLMFILDYINLVLYLL